MTAPRGYAAIVGPDAPIKECDTITCCHCQRVVFLKPKQDPTEAGGFCRLCFRHTCGPCADRGVCDPFERQLERMEARGATLRSMGFS